KIGFPKFKAKKNHHLSYTTNCVNGNIRLQDNYLILPKVKAIKIKQHREIPQDYILKSVTVSKTPSGKYFASILFEYERNIKQIVPQSYIGLDFSMKELYVASDGSSACYPRYYRLALDKLAKESRKLSKMEKGSNNRNKQRIQVARLHEKVANQRKDFLHKLSRQITNAYDCVCIEDLEMKGMSQALNFGKSVADNSFGAFVTMLGYKLSEQGKQLIKIDKWFPSTKTCSNCGSVQTISLEERTYTCKSCGVVINRDYNASINIRNEGMRLVSI
ncbi:MAG: RNA-guided endonuclease TnpB family protein, partial [Erysipelotrichaceae bacterium]